MRLALCALALALLPARGQEPFHPSNADLQRIQTKVAELTAATDSLRAAKADDDLLVDVEVCLRAARNIVRFPEEFFDQRHVDNAVSALDRGLERARQLREGKPVWPGLKGRVSRGYRSRVDGVPQPYRLIIPESYDPSKPARLYVYLHGRGDTDLEVNWVAGRDVPSPSPVQVPYIQLQAFGRANTNFHWPGETDVLEAVESVRKRYNIDPDRIVLRGFSMGGAGAWHVGLHYPDLWAALESAVHHADL
jgi:acetyl esterase/lipase